MQFGKPLFDAFWAQTQVLAFSTTLPSLKKQR
jgi:hypothetical protein